jgi:hypothetical protein
VDLARDGDSAAGCEILLAGMQHAKELHSEGLAWVEELVGRCASAADGRKRVMRQQAWS